jgi:transposase-like protein
MSEREKKRKKKKQFAFLVEEQGESQSSYQLVEILDELAKEGKYVDIQICPRCKSPKIRRVGTMTGDVLGHMGILSQKFECKECGWRARLVLKATNRPLSVKDVAVIAEASDLEKARKEDNDAHPREESGQDR